MRVAWPPLSAWKVDGLVAGAVKKKTCGTSPLNAANRYPAAADGSLGLPWGRACPRRPRASNVATEVIMVLDL